MVVTLCSALLSSHFLQHPFKRRLALPLLQKSYNESSDGPKYRAMRLRQVIAQFEAVKELRGERKLNT
jgi:hypothetical protein